MSSLMNQETRFLRWLGELAQQWVLLSLEGQETLSQPYCWTTAFRLASGAAAPAVGNNVTCEIGTGNRRRLVNGVITQIEQHNGQDGVKTFKAQIEPALVLTKPVRKMRVFQRTTVPDLVMSLLKEYDINDVKLSLSREYAEKEYLIQYQESDFSFINRLLEAAGITYFFVHHDGKHDLVLADHTNAWPEARIATQPWLPVAGKQQNHGVLSWLSRDALAQNAALNAHQHDEIYPQAVANQAAEKVDGVALSVAELQYEGMSCGESFTLENHPSADNRYTVYSLSFRGQSNLESSADFHCQVELFPADVTFNPERATPVPHIGGVLTATVVGPDSEEIHTDELGRVKIQFPWDEEHPHDDSSSCWMRVSQPWSAGNFGALFLPRVASEVLVSFVQGHPDYPIITGAVYSERHKPPMNLPNEKNLSGFVSHSSLDGEINEGHRLVFDDKKQQERLVISSQKDLQLTVKNDANITIGANRTSEITQGNDLLTLKKGDHKTSISGGGSELQAEKACVIESKESITLKVGSSELTLKPDGITLKASKVTIKADGDVAINGAKVDVKGSAMVTVDGGLIKLG